MPNIRSSNGRTVRLNPNLAPEIDILKNLLVNSIEFFVRLMSSVDQTDDYFFGIKPTDTNAVTKIARCSAQFIEICSWLGIIPTFGLRLSRLCAYLETQSANDPEFMLAHPSRLKSVLLFGNYNKETMEYSLRSLVDQKNRYLHSDSVTQMAYTDLLGSYLMQSKNPQKPIWFPDAPQLIQASTDIHKEFLDRHWKDIHDIKVRETFEARDLSYAIWLLFISRYYEGKSKGTYFDPDLEYLEERCQQVASGEALREYRRIDFSRIVYPHLFLYFFRRKYNREVNTNPNYLTWLRNCSSVLRGDFDPFHAGLIIKQAIAAAKGDFLMALQNMGMDALQENQASVSATSPAERQLVEDTLRNAIHIEVTESKQLTRGKSGAKVYRVSASINEPMVAGNCGTAQKLYALKLGTEKDIQDATKIYLALPLQAQKLFVRHDQILHQGVVGTEGYRYIVMEWLSGHKELAAIINDVLPESMTQVAYKEHIEKSVNACLALISNLHNTPIINQEAFAHPPSYDYRMADLFRFADKLRSKESYCERAIQYGGKVNVSDRVFRIPSARDITNRLLRLSDKIPGTDPILVAERDVLVHGDCHGYNVMINQDMSKALFIDLPNVRIDDYLYDYAELIAHLCFSVNVEVLTDEELISKVEPFGYLGKGGLGTLDYLYPERWDGLELVYSMIESKVRESIKMREAINGMPRFAFLIGWHLVSLAAESSSPIQAYILYLEGTILLTGLVRALEAKEDEDVQTLRLPPGQFFKLSLH